MKKTALLIHGWPCPIEEDSFYRRYFEANGYRVVCPYLFSGKDFNLEFVVETVKKELAGEEPVVILGFSLGGLILPHIAKAYSEAKLVMIATAVRFYPESVITRNFLKALRNKRALKTVYGIVQTAPNELALRLGDLIDPLTHNRDFLDEHRVVMAKNIYWGKKIPLSVNEQILKFAFETDNTEVLRGLKNETIIFAGRKDKLMPVSEGEKIHQLIANSCLVVTSGSHFNVFTEKELKYLDKFFGKI